MQILRTLFYLAVDPFDFEAERNSRRRNTVSSNRENFSFYEKEKNYSFALQFSRWRVPSSIYQSRCLDESKEEKTAKSI